MLTNQMVRGATLDISEQRFRVNLMVMPGLVLDVIIGMKWMKDWGVVIDAGRRMLSCRDPQGEGTFQVLLARWLDIASISCAMQVVPLTQIPRVCEFPDVFSDELPRLPQIGRLSFPSSWYLVWHRSLGDHTRCSLTSLLN